jgi:hypothetical protein
MLKKTKQYLKDLAVEIRELKSQRKLPKRGNQSLWSIETKIYKLKYEFRHFHISYCEIRGRKRDQIEKPSKYNLPNQKYIEQIKEKILKEYDEQQTICAVAA